MKIRNPRSLSIIAFYVVLNLLVVVAAYQKIAEDQKNVKSKKIKKELEITRIYNLEYFFLKQTVPELSLKADEMESVGQSKASFIVPRGIYNRLEDNQSFNYEAKEGAYQKNKGILSLMTEVKVSSEEGNYRAEKIDYYLKQDLVVATGGVKFDGIDPKTKDKLKITAQSMRANPRAQFSRFIGQVEGEIQRQKNYEGKTLFKSHELTLEGPKSLAHLDGDVFITRQNYVITSGKADIFLENYNKSLKYFVLNDDVKVTETLQTEQGQVQRKAYGERLEGFGREQKMVLTGAPRVEQGEDIIKGYKITIREDVDLVEVDDSLSDVKVKKEKSKKN